MRTIPSTGVTAPLTSTSLATGHTSILIPAIILVSISGDFNRIYLYNTTDAGRLISIDQWGDIMWTSMEGAFYGTNMTIAASDVPDLSRTTSMRNMFAGSSVTGDMSNWNVSSIVDMSRMFYVTVAFTQRRHLLLGRLLGHRHVRDVPLFCYLQPRHLLLGCILGHRHVRHVR